MSEATDPISVIYRLKKSMQNQMDDLVQTVANGGVDSMEEYKYMLGQAQAYQIVLQEISNLLNNDEKEQNDGNVIDIKGSTKN